MKAAHVGACGAGQSTRTWAQRARSDAYFPDTVSRPARRLLDARQVWTYWRDRTGPATGYALDRESMLTIAERACRDIAATLIAEGFAA